MKQPRRNLWWLVGVTAACLWCAPAAVATGQYALAYWREVAGYENHSAPGGGGGIYAAFVHVWDENGQPLGGKQIYTSWGVLLGTTDANGFTEIELHRPNGYDFQIRDGSQLSETTPVLSEERPPNPGFYSYEIGFLFKQNAANPGTFDTNSLGTINSSGASLCRDLQAPCTRSLAYYSTSPYDYCSDASALGNWTASHGQTFVATGNRVIALRGLMAVGGGAHYYYTAQICEGGPGGTPVGPAHNTRLMVDGEDFPILVKWGVNDVQVVPGRTYYFKISRAEGLNVYRVNQNNYAFGNYYENDVSVPGAELMGLVVCATYTNSGPTGTLIGFVHDPTQQPVSGVVVTVTDAGLYGISGADGGYTIPYVPAGTYDVTASKSGYVGKLNTGVVIPSSLTATSSFTLALMTTNAGSGIVTNGESLLQPFDATPAWSSSYDATWGSAGSFASVGGGQTGNALQALRAGPGSSARAQVLPLRPNTSYSLSVWARCPSFSTAYWVECGYRLGNNPAQDFDANPGNWTYLKKFSDTGANGNANTWTQYAVNFNSGANTQITVGFKVGASSGTGPTVYWDQLALVSMTPPIVALAVANSPSNVTVQFFNSLNQTTATNLASYHLDSGAGGLSITGATLADGTNVLLTTAPQTARQDYTLTVSNVAGLLQPVTLSGLNGQISVRVPLTLLADDDQTFWKYNQGGTNLGTTWRLPAYDDSQWPTGPGLLGEASGPLPDPIRTDLTVGTNKTTFYFRKTFVLPSTATNALLRLTPIIDDGAAFYLNGVEFLRVGMGSALLGYQTRAARTVGLAAWEGPFDATVPGLVIGTNLLAAEVHQADPSSPDVVFGTTVQALVRPSQLPIPRPVLSISRSADQVRVSWTHPGATLLVATNLLGPWQARSTTTNSISVTAADRAQFFRLSSP